LTRTSVPRFEFEQRMALMGQRLNLAAVTTGLRRRFSTLLVLLLTLRMH